MHPPLATLVIPAYRESARLPALLDDLAAEAIAAQQPPIDFVVVDDGSGPEEADRERAATLAFGARLEAARTPHRARFLSVAKNLERIADHATNIAEDVVFVCTGEIVRHRTH